mmetsp:Transcript_6554/g.28831  ORF Transcript_6554/g.28831 Transcript_6554/m.28831 type:complete len:220 (-) Transcript_6554:756-1415(-)
MRGFRVESAPDLRAVAAAVFQQKPEKSPRASLGARVDARPVRGRLPANLLRRHGVDDPLGEAGHLRLVVILQFVPAGGYEVQHVPPIRGLLINQPLHRHRVLRLPPLTAVHLRDGAHPSFHAVGVQVVQRVPASLARGDLKHVPSRFRRPRPVVFAARILRRHIRERVQETDPLAGVLHPSVRQGLEPLQRGHHRAIRRGRTVRSIVGVAAEARSREFR